MFCQRVIWPQNTSIPGVPWRQDCISLNPIQGLVRNWCSFIDWMNQQALILESHFTTQFAVPLNRENVGLPWWCSGWESACQCRGHGFGPWSGRIPQAAEQLGPWATTTEPARLEPMLCNKRGRDSERPAHSDEEWPPLAATIESPRTETKTQHSQN